MLPPTSLIQLTAVLLTSLTPVCAQLVFQTDSVEHSAKFGEQVVDAKFPFVNKGTKTVNIMEVGSTCGCTVPEAKVLRYAPGESGVITARFTIGDRTDEQTSHITVKTDAGPHLLTLKISIPARIRITPRLLIFDRDTAGPHTVEINYLEDRPVALPTVTSEPGELTSKLTAIKPGQSYRLTIPAPDTDAQDRYTLRIHSQGKSGVKYSDTVYVRVIR